MNDWKELTNLAMDFNKKLLAHNGELMHESAKRYSLLSASLRKLHLMSLKYALLKKQLRRAS